MSIVGVQLILIFFALFMIYILIIHWRKRDIGKMTLFLWLIIWLVFILLTMIPKILEESIIGTYFVRAMDFGMIISFMILTYITIENNIYHKKTEEKIEKVVRYLSKHGNKIKL